MTPSLDALGDAERQLKSGPTSEFVERRRALAAEARAKGDKALARDIAALRKPSAAAAALNHVALDGPPELIDLLDLGAELRSAVAAGDELRPLLARRQALLDTVTRLAARRADADNEPLSATAAAQVAQTLRAVLADAEGAALLREARLDAALPEPGFDAWPAGPPRASLAAVPSLPSEQADTAPGDATLTIDPVAIDPAATEARLSLERARAELEERATTLAVTSRRRVHAEAELLRLEAELADARRAAEAASRAELDARLAHETAEATEREAAARWSAIESGVSLGPGRGSP